MASMLLSHRGSPGQEYLHGKWIWIVALTFSQAPHCLSTSNARRDAAGHLWLAVCCGVCSSHPACLQCQHTAVGTGSFPATLTSSSSLPAAPTAAMKPQLTWLHLPEPGNWIPIQEKGTK